MSDPKTDEKPFTISGRIQAVLAALAGMTTGMASAVTATHSEFQKKLLEFWDHDDGPTSKVTSVETPLQQQYKAHGIELEKLTASRANGELTTLEYLKKSREQKTKFGRQLNTFAKEHLGIESEAIPGLFKGTVQRFGYMGKDTRRGILFNTAVATTVGVAGTLMFFNSINMHNKLSKVLDNQQDRNDPER